VAHNEVFEIDIKKFYLSINKEEAEVLLNILNLFKEFYNFLEENVVLYNLINKIYESVQGFIDEDLINQKEIFKHVPLNQIYNNFISLFDKAEEPITINVNENIKYANPAFIKMLGYESESEILKLGLFNIVSDRYLTKIKNYYKMRLKGNIVPNIHDLELKRADGRTILIECVHYCMPFKDLNLIICFYIDLHKIKSLEKKLRKSEEKYHSLFKSSIEGVLISDNEGKFSSVNPAAASLLGYDGPEEMIGMPALNIYIDPSHREPIIKGMTETGYLKDFEIQLNKKDCTPIDTIFNATLHKDEDGNLRRIEAFFKDITESKKIEEELRLHSEIMTNMAEGVYLIRTNDGIITYTNPKFEKMFGYKQGEMIGKNVSIVNAPTDKDPRETAKEIMEILERTGEWHGEVKNIKKDGTQFWCYANVSTFDHPEYGRVWVSVHSDITERKRAEQRLKESEEKYRDAYDMANFYKDLFAHDINNILNNIKFSGELISLDLNNPEKLKNMEDLLDIIKDQVNRGAKLISNVQKLSQLEEKENEISIKSMEVCKVLKDAIQFTHKSFPTKNISIQIESIGKKLFVQANNLLLDVFENLLNNGVKFNDNPRIDILIKISKFQKKGIKYIKMEFMDNGMGITDDRKKLIFQKTYKKDISVRGMGFGLSLVKKIMDSYNGEIWVEDNVIGDHTKGSNFIILIPEVV